MDMSYQKNSIMPLGGISMGVGVMIGAGIFALTGQIAELAGPWFPLSFVAGAVVTGFSAYGYIKISNAWPSAGGIAMILEKIYGPGTIAAAASVLMVLSMIINESLVARAFGAYALRPFSLEGDGTLVSVLGVLLIIAAYLVNALGARSVGGGGLSRAGDPSLDRHLHAGLSDRRLRGARQPDDREDRRRQGFRAGQRG